MQEFPADDSRLAEVILYVSARCAAREDFDPVMLDRILFQSDFLHYRSYGTPITGQAYRRGPSGPTPRGLSRVLRGLAREFSIVETPEGDGLHVRRRPAALRAARVSAFSARELATVEEVLAHYLAGPGAGGPRGAGPWSIGTRSEESDRAGRDSGRGATRGEFPDYLEIPWQEAGPRALLPYSLALAAPEPGGAPAGAGRMAACPA